MLVAELTREADLPATPSEPPTTAVPRTGFAEAGSTFRRQGEGLAVKERTQWPGFGHTGPTQSHFNTVPTAASTRLGHREQGGEGGRQAVRRTVENSTWRPGD